MTIRELIKRLENFDLDMTVVIKPTSVGGDYFVEIATSNILELKTEEIPNLTKIYNGRLFDASEKRRDRTVKVLSLTGGTLFQRGENGKNSKDL